MRVSKFFQFSQKEAPKHAELISHKYMIKSSMIRMDLSGIYSWLPLGMKVLQKINSIIRREQNLAGSQEILMPTIQSSDIWIKSGRYDGYGREMLRIKDRNGKNLLYGPTNEELVTSIFADVVKSYKKLPINLFQIQHKFRDEIRPRHGVMRSREFIMKDGYSFDIDAESAKNSYIAMFVSYLRTFDEMGIKALPMRADTGPIGGDLSHEFLLLSDTGETDVIYDRRLQDLSWPARGVDYEGNLNGIFEEFTSFEIFEAPKSQEEVQSLLDANENLVCAKAIEIGHIFYFGTKYSEKLAANIQDKNGEITSVHMGSYGIGPTRCVAALIERFYDGKGVAWPKAVRPFDAHFVTLGKADDENKQLCEQIYSKLISDQIDVLYDDTNESAGFKLNNADLIGVPLQIIAGPRILKQNQVEIKFRDNKTDPLNIDIDKLSKFIKQFYAS